MVIVAVSGGFDPVHKGHIEYFKKAKELANCIDKCSKVVCILNSDKFLIDKKGYAFMNFNERKTILESIKYIDEVIECIDSDQSVCETLRMLKPNIFAKGGDRNVGNIPEKEVCNELGIKIIDCLGDKIQSSSKLGERLKLIKGAL